jgi:hypothetical protein
MMLWRSNGACTGPICDGADEAVDCFEAVSGADVVLITLMEEPEIADDGCCQQSADWLKGNIISTRCERCEHSKRR